jgi:hypothetical protein
MVVHISAPFLFIAKCFTVWIFDILFVFSPVDILGYVHSLGIINHSTPQILVFLYKHMLLFSRVYILECIC